MSIDLTGNPLAEKENYREKLFEIFPNLQVSPPSINYYIIMDSIIDIGFH